MIQRKARGKRQTGQGLIEFAMAIVMIVGINVLIQNQLKRAIGKIWTAMAKDIAAGCPGCTPPDQIK